MTFRITFAYRQCQGGRSYQEDHTLVRHIGDLPPDPGSPTAARAGEGLLAILADGMGGHAGGSIASTLATTTFEAAFAASDATIPARLARSLDAANRALAERIVRDRHLHGMGTTLVAAFVGQVGLHWVSVGDSLLYILKGQELERINADHSLAPMLDEMVADGRMTPEAARNDGRRHMLRSAVSGQEIELVDLSLEPRSIGPGDTILLASDGLDTLPEAAIRDILVMAADKTDDYCERAAEALIAAVMTAELPHQDNTTVIVARLSACD